MHFVIVPGIGDSEHSHWQSIWQQEWGPSASRITVSSWTAPDLDDWCAAIDNAVHERALEDVVLVAHSLGCLAVTRWADTRRGAVKGVFLAAPPDSTATTFPDAASTFAQIARRSLGIPGLLVASADDPYCGLDTARRLASDWSVPLIDGGNLGHINATSGVGRWTSGRHLLTAFTAGLHPPTV
jgi:predicted alpha/beta hydrolase family esterase